MRSLAPLLALLCLLPCLHADRDRSDGRRRPETARVVLYSGENFDGVAVELLPGAEVPELGDLRFADGRKVRDRISSVRVFGDVKVTLYASPGFKGEGLEVTDSIARLERVARQPGGRGNWDNCVSSVRVSGGRSERDRDDGWDRDRPRRDDRRPDRDDYSDREAGRLVVRAFRELLAREPNEAELDRYVEAIVGAGWDRDRVRDEIRDTREYRSKEANAIVERVYRDLLGREPDPAGRAHWIKKIVDKRWDERKFRDEIRDSEEYRRKRAEGRPNERH